MSIQTPERNLANRTLTFAYAMNSVTNAWVRPLIDPALNQQPELRNRLFCLLATGMLDAGWEYKNRMNALKIEAKKIGSKSCPYYLDLFERYVALSIELLAVLSRDETIFITELRNQWLHGRWDEVHKSERTIKYAKSGIIQRDKMPKGEYDRAFRLFTESGNIDVGLMALRTRFCQHKTYFWAIDRMLAAPPIQQAVLTDLVLHAKFSAPKVVFKVPDPSFKPPNPDESYASLLEFGPKVLGPN